MTSDRGTTKSERPQTANPKRTQVDEDPRAELERTQGDPKRSTGRPHGDPHDQDWPEVAEEVREAVEESGRDTDRDSADTGTDSAR